MNTGKTIRNILIAGSVLFAFANPFTRAIILWLLPLGHGVDDLIEVVALVVLACMLGSYWYRRYDFKHKFFEVNDQGIKARQVAWVMATIAIAFISPLGAEFRRVILYGNSLDISAYIFLAVTFGIVCLGWFGIGKIYSKGKK
jgi:hypothetical protein